jgi:protein tyrosine/serine phosphatase
MGDLAMIQKALTELPKPWLIHCSAGIDRTGAAVEFVRNRPFFQTKSVPN